MALLKTLGMGQGYLKAGFLGFNKSGKSRTSVELAIGVRDMLGHEAPIAMFDTEGGSEYLAPLVKQRTGLDLVGIKSRSFDDLMEATRECEQGAASVLIVDSVTHIWRELSEAYKKKVRRTRFTIQDIMTIKDLWAPWPDLYLNAALHIIICGRAGFEWDMVENEDTGKRELVKTGVKMKVESEFGFEPSLLVEMERIQEMDGKTRIVHRATVIGDRYGLIDGQQCDDPTFDFFKPHVEMLKPASHTPIDTSTKSNPDVDDNGDREWAREKKQRAIYCEEIQGELLRKYPSQSATDKFAKAELISFIFNTRSWTRVEQLHSGELRNGLDTLRELLKDDAKLKEILNQDEPATA